MLKKKENYSFVQICLTVLSVSALLISNIITAKQAQFPFGITMTCAIFIFPITYILSDVFSEVYGYKWSRITCYLGFAMNILMVIMFELSIATPAPDYWGNQEAFKLVLGNSPRVLIASLTAFVLGDFINDKVFQKMKEKQVGLKGFGTRAIVSSLCGDFIDSLIFIPLAFIGTMPVETMVVMLFTQVILKLLYEIIILPVTTIITTRISKYENNN